MQFFPHIFDPGVFESVPAEREDSEAACTAGTRGRGDQCSKKKFCRICGSSLRTSVQRRCCSMPDRNTLMRGDGIPEGVKETVKFQ